MNPPTSLANQDRASVSRSLGGRSIIALLAVLVGGASAPPAAMEAGLWEANIELIGFTREPKSNDGGVRLAELIPGLIEMTRTERVCLARQDVRFPAFGLAFDPRAECSLITRKSARNGTFDFAGQCNGYPDVAIALKSSGRVDPQKLMRQLELKYRVPRTGETAVVRLVTRATRISDCSAIDPFQCPDGDCPPPPGRSLPLLGGLGG